jgi:hypothetical protein
LLGSQAHPKRNQLARNGDVGKHLLVKMDIESAEWDVFTATSERTLESIVLWSSPKMHPADRNDI